MPFKNKPNKLNKCIYIYEYSMIQNVFIINKIFAIPIFTAAQNVEKLKYQNIYH